MRQRNLLWMVVFSLITFGIYFIYWLISTRNELNRLDYRVPSGWWLLTPGLFFVALAIILIFAASASEANGAESAEPAIISGIGGVLALLGWFATIGVYIWWFWRYSEAVASITDDKLNFVLTIVLLYLLNWIGAIVIQDFFNKLETPEEATDQKKSSAS